MKIISGDLWEINLPGKVLKCITTNGILKSNRELVMGKGVALHAKLKYPELPKIFGKHVSEHGNTACAIPEYNLASFPLNIIGGTRAVYY